MADNTTSYRTSISNLVTSSDNDLRAKFIDYQNSYREDNKEFLRGDMWELEFTSPPSIVYFPGNELINRRLNSVNVGIDYSVSGIEKRMRGGYSILQQTNQNTSATLSLEFVDREDQAISYFVQDWRNKIADPDTKYSFRKSDWVCDVTLHITNSSRLDVRTLFFWNCVPTEATLDENGQTDAETDRSNVMLGLRAEHYQRKFENL